MGQHALSLTLLLGTSLHSKFLWVGCFLLTSVFLVGISFKMLIGVWRRQHCSLGGSLFCLTLTQHLNHAYIQRYLKKWVVSLSDPNNQDTLGFKNSREGLHTSDPELLLSWYWLWWRRVLEIASKVWERVVRSGEYQLTVSHLGMLQGLKAQLKSEASPMTSSLVQA